MTDEQKREDLRKRLEPEIKVTQSSYVPGAQYYVTRAKLGPIEDQEVCRVPMCPACRSGVIAHVMFKVFKREGCYTQLELNVQFRRSAALRYMEGI